MSPATDPPGGNDRTVITTSDTGAAATVQVPPVQPDSETGVAPPATEARGNRRSDRRFERGDLLGEGGLSTVHMARDAALRRLVALKFLKLGDRDSAQRFLEEAQITAQLQHPNIVPVYDLGFDAQGHQFLAMKPVEGDELAAVIAQAHQASGGRGAGERLRELLEIFVKVCDAVGYAHKSGVIHRDLKPANIMVGAFGEVLVMDWGLAKPIGYQSDKVTDEERRALDRSSKVTTDRRLTGTHTVVGTIQGTPAYMAPEQAQGGATLDAGCDIYALGGILYTLLTNKLPIEGDSVADQLSRVLEHQVLPPRRRAPTAGIPPELEAIVLKAMQYARADRYPDVPVLRSDIEAYLDDRFVSAARYTSFQRLQKWVRRHPTGVVATAMSGLLVAIVASGLSLYLESERRAQQETVARAEAEHEAIVQREQAAQAREQEALAREQQALAQAEAAGERERAAQQETERIAAEQRERDERIQRLLQEKKYAELQRDVGSLKREVGIETEGARDATIAEFMGSWEAMQKQGRTQEEFVASLSRNDMDRYLAAFERRFAAFRHGAAQLVRDDYFYYGVLLHLGARRFNDAIAQYDTVLKLDKTDKAALVNRGMAQYELGRYDKALADQTSAIETWPDARSNWLNRGVTYFAMGNYDAAIADYRKLLALDARDVRGWVNLAAALSRKGQHAEALDAAQRALAVDPKVAEAHNALGTIYQAMDRRDEALKSFSEAIRLKPAFAPFHANRGRLYAVLGQPDRSLEDLGRAIELGSTDATVRSDRAVALFKLGRLADAQKDLDAVLAANPKDTRALSTRAAVRGRQGDLGGALADLNAYLQIVPDDALALSNRCATHHRLGNLQQAFADADRAVQLRPNDARMLSNRGDMNRVLERYDAARADLQHAVQLDPAYYRAWVYLGQTELALKNTRGAMDAFGKAIAGSGEKDPGVYFARAEANEQLGDRDSAANDYLAAIRIDGKHCDSWYHLGLLRLAQKNPAAARETLTQAQALCTEPEARTGVAKALQGL